MSVTDAVLPGAFPPLPARRGGGRLAYWAGLPWCWARQVVRNGSDILRVLDITHLRPMPAGLVGLDHPWVTGINPATGRHVWHDNVIYRSPRGPETEQLADDDIVATSVGRFMAERVRQSAVVPELPIGPKRRMPHSINYMHGASHFNSGLILLNDLADGYRHITDPEFRRELRRFVREERREVLFLFRDRRYDPREYAYFSCCVRTLFPWFCNPNGPQDRILWGNAAPFPAANVITGHWADDVYALKRTGGAERVVRPPIRAGDYFSEGPYDGGRGHSVWPEKLLAWGTYFRVRIRGARGGMYFVDRRQAFADQIRNRESRGLPGERRAQF